MIGLMILGGKTKKKTRKTPNSQTWLNLKSSLNLQSNFYCGKTKSNILHGYFKARQRRFFILKQCFPFQFAY